MKYIKLWETWQWLNREEDSDEERDYRATVGELLDWAAGPGWREDPEHLIDSLMVDDEWPDEHELIGYHEQLKQNSGVEVSVYSQQADGQILSDWRLGDTEFVLVSFDWPFNSDEGLDVEQLAEYDRLARGLEPWFEKLGANRADIIDFIVDRTGRGESDLSVTGFMNWFALKRLGKN